MDHDSKDINFKKQRKIEDKSSLQKKKNILKIKVMDSLGLERSQTEKKKS